MKIVLVGGSNWLGRDLMRKLLSEKKSFHLTWIDNLSSEYSSRHYTWDFEYLKDDCFDFQYGDITSYDFLKSIICKDSIIIYKNPEIQLAFDNDIESCSPFHIVFEDTGRYADTRQWFYGNSAITAIQKDSFIETLVGNHNLRLIANNTKGCSDTADQIITVLETPVASFFYSR